MPGLAIPQLIADNASVISLDVSQIQRFVNGFFAGTDQQFTLIAGAGAVLGQQV